MTARKILAGQLGIPDEIIVGFDVMSWVRPVFEGENATALAVEWQQQNTARRTLVRVPMADAYELAVIPEEITPAELVAKDVMVRNRLAEGRATGGALPLSGDGPA